MQGKGLVPTFSAAQKTWQRPPAQGVAPRPRINGAPFEKALTESISRLMSEPDLLKKYGAAGRARTVNEFGWDEVAAATVALYRRVIA